MSFVNSQGINVSALSGANGSGSYSLDGIATTGNLYLTANAGNIALLERAQALGLLPDGTGHAAADAYRELRRVQHRARLNEEPTHVTPPVLDAQRQAVLALWSAVFS